MEVGRIARMWQKTKAMKLRLLLMGSIISALGVVLLASKGYGTGFTGLLITGIILLTVGLLWK